MGTSRKRGGISQETEPEPEREGQMESVVEWGLQGAMHSRERCDAGPT